ncbi:hypothetical protein F5Y14DRAFT_438199 [Nemania sp. NC0429]|nr:hypothetical protein F5Y14DRAFT_438199 [Nemania sp. NC0429]
MSIYRIALRAIVETCVSQGAWIWVSSFRKGETEARLEDFKMFDEASRGVYGALTANCTWPVFPSLAVCGVCTESSFSTLCDSTSGCSYSMPSGTSIFSAAGASSEYHFTVAPSNGSSLFPDTDSRAIISIFDIMSSAKTPQETTVRAHQCGLWFCVRSYNVTVTNGVIDRVVTMEWSNSKLVPKSSARLGEYVFTDIPPQMNAKELTRYTVPADSLETLKEFMDKLTLGNASRVAGAMSYDSDWIQAIEAASQDISGWVSRLALSLTKDIQLTGTVRPNGNSEYSGTAYVMGVHVKVNWYWVAYPVSLMIFAFLYLMETGQGLTTAAQMLFCHVSRTIHAQVRDGMDVPEGLSHHVGHTEVELVRQDDGEWIFTEPRNH